MNVRWLAVLSVLFAVSAQAAEEASAVPAAPAAAPAPATTPAPAAAPAHRPLRQNVIPAEPAAPTDPETFAGYLQAPVFKVVPQKDKIALYPCSQCHKAMTPNPTPRKLEAAPHQAALKHGKGRLWCLNCHLIDDRDFLHTVRGQKVDFDEAYLVCGQCHFNRQKDWYLGGHGKRVSNWQGERTLYSCTHCHDPHDPITKPREPSKAPPVRAGLQRTGSVAHESGKVWERQRQGKVETSNER